MTNDEIKMSKLEMKVRRYAHERNFADCCDNCPCDPDGDGKGCKNDKTKETCEHFVLIHFPLKALV